MEMVKIDKYKVAYWNPKDPTALYSKMFSNLEAARFFGESLRSQGLVYTLMELQKAGDGEYAWRVKGGGLAFPFQIANTLYAYRWLILLLFLLRRRR